MSLKGNTSSLSKLSAKLRELPRTVGQKIAANAAPAITALAKKTFDESATAYGIPWAPGADGQRITLKKTGALAKFVYYVSIGTKLRVALGVPYAKYQIGKRPIFPTQGAALPTLYVRKLEEVSSATIGAEIGGSK